VFFIEKLQHFKIFLQVNKDMLHSNMSDFTPERISLYALKYDAFLVSNTFIIQCVKVERI
jgi:hypothetical protein